MAVISYPFRVVDNSGNMVPGATIMIGTVTLAVNTAVAVPGAKSLSTGGTLNGSTGIAVIYQDFGDGSYVLTTDPEAYGEAYVPIVPSKAGSTITGASALIAVICTKDSSRVQVALPNAALPSDSSIAADVQTGLTAQGITAARAGYLDALNGIVTAIWAAAARTLTSISNSSGISTLLTYFSGAVAPQSGDAYARLGAPAGANVSADIATANSALSLALSLIGQNQGVRNQQYDGSGNLISADICAYDTAAHAATNDGATGLVHKWSLALTYGGGVQEAQSLSQVS